MPLLQCRQVWPKLIVLNDAPRLLVLDDQHISYFAEKSVHCEMDRDRNVGQVKCSQCNEHWETKIHSLSEPIDVYSEWIDDCEAANAG